MMVNFSPAFAQTSSNSFSITVKTDHVSYYDGEQIVISGTVETLLNTPISVIVKSPSGGIVAVGQTTPSSDKTFSTIITAGGSLWTDAGTYEVSVTYGSKTNTANTTFQFSGFQNNFPVVIQGQKYNATYKITNGKLLDVIPNVDTKSLTLRVQPAGNGTVEITMPRILIDAKNGAQDSEFVVEKDGVKAAFNESKTDVNRTLTISFGSSNKQILIMGTRIIPEFGPVALLIMTLGISFIILFYKKTLYRLRIV